VEVFLSRMTWSRKFAQPIALKDGRMIGTLAAACFRCPSSISERLSGMTLANSWRRPRLTEVGSRMRRRNYRKP
jgi:hypothetical protein